MRPMLKAEPLTNHQGGLGVGEGVYEVSVFTHASCPTRRRRTSCFQGSPKIVANLLPLSVRDVL